MFFGMFHHLLRSNMGFKQEYDFTDVPSGIATGNKVPVDKVGLNVDIFEFTEDSPFSEVVGMTCSVAGFTEESPFSETVGLTCSMAGFTEDSPFSESVGLTCEMVDFQEFEPENIPVAYLTN